MLIKRQIPNMITLGNLFCGCLGIIAALQSNYNTMILYVVLALIFDFLDGFVARALKVSSPIGKELDSLADMVTFGVLPGFCMYNFLLETAGASHIAYLAFMIPLFSALRLAKFNIDTRQTDRFLGLPTPANAAFFCTLPLIDDLQMPFLSILKTAYFIAPAIIVFSLLLISELPLIALKFTTYAFGANAPRYGLIISALVLFVLFSLNAVPMIILLYILVSAVDNYVLKKAG